MPCYGIQKTGHPSRIQIWATTVPIKTAIKRITGWYQGVVSGVGVLSTFRQRPYRGEYTGSLQNSEVNHRRARIVLRWGTAREVLRVLLALFAASAVAASSLDTQLAVRSHGYRSHFGSRYSYVTCHTQSFFRDLLYGPSCIVS